MIKQNCDVKGHENCSIFFICIRKDCKEKKKYGCAKCMKPLHSKCNLESMLTIEELSYEENLVYPKWVESI
jgi:hypothetical protein